MASFTTGVTTSTVSHKESAAKELSVMLFSEPLAQTGVPVYAPNLRPPLLDRGEEQLVGCRGCNLTARLAILAGPEWPGWGLPLLGLLLPHAAIHLCRRWKLRYQLYALLKLQSSLIYENFSCARTWLTD